MLSNLIYAKGIEKMRMWMVKPKLLCNQHLIGEHGELHKHLHSFRKGHKVDGRFNPVVQIQFQGYLERHDELAKEMLARRMNHKSPLKDLPDFQKIYPEYYDLKVNKWKSLVDLYCRCHDCAENIVTAYYEDLPY